MASSLLTTDRRWAAPARKSGMTVLGKVPKPINLPSQRSENNGLDPNLEIVPKGTLTWGSKPPQTPPNAWGSSSILSTKNDGSSSSPSHLNGRPSSGGGSRPSTAGSESLGSPNAWGPNSRPSSASSTVPSSHLPMATNRPRSAETRPGSSHLSRFADNASENVKISIRTIDRSASSSHGQGFTLSTGDFPTLGSEKCSESNSQRGHSSKGRPTSSSGKEASQNEQGKSLTAGPGEVSSPPRNQSVDILKTDQQHTHTGGAPFPGASLPNEGQQPQPYPPNFHMPPQFDSWRAPTGHASEGMWHRGAAPGGPYRPVGPPGSFPGEPFGYYGQFPPNSEAAARQGSGHGGYHPKSGGDSYHPVPPNSYIMNQPVIPVRPVYQGPGPYDGYYGPRANFNNANVRDPHFVGGPRQPGILNQFPNQNDNFHHGHSQGRQGKHEPFPREQLESGRVQVFNRGQPRILHDNPDRVGGTHEVERNAQPAPPLLPHPDGNQTNLNMRTDMRDGFGDRNRGLTKLVPDQRGPAGIEHPSAFDNAHSLPRDIVDGTLRKKFKEDDNSGMLDQQPVIKKNAALIEKIESLNNKARNVDARNVLEPASSKEFKSLQKGTDSKSDQVMKDVPPTAVVAGIASASNRMDSVPHISSVLQRSPNVSTDGSVVGPPHSQSTEFSKAGKLGDSNNDRAHRRGDSSRNSLHGSGKVRSANKFAGHGRGESSTTNSLQGIDLRNNNQHDQPPEGASQLQLAPVTDDMPASLDYESQRAKMRELAVQRAKKLQAEEEERIKNQKAKALAKLEELNRRSAVLQKNSNDTTVGADDGHSKQTAGLDVTANLDNSTADLRDVAMPDSLSAPQPPSDQHSMVLVQPRSTTLSHGTGAGKDPVADAASSAGNIQSNIEHVVQKSVTQSYETNVPKPKQGLRKWHIASEEKNPGEKPGVPVGTGNAKKNVESSLEMRTAVTTSHDNAPAPNKKGARHLRNKKKVEDTPVTQHPPVVFNEQNTPKVSSEPKTYTGGVIISSSIVPTEGTIVTVGSITVGGIALPSLKQDCVKSSEGTPNTENNRSRHQQAKRSGKHQHAVRPVDKPGNEGVSWAPVKQPEQNEQSDRAMPNTALSDPTQLSGKSSNDGENGTRIKRAEMERYVPKPLSKELQQQNQGPTCVDNKSHDKETVEKSSDAKVDPATEPKKWEDKKASKGHGKSHPSWRRRYTHESASVAPNADQAENSHGSKDVQKSADQNQPIETDRQEIKQLKPHADTPAESSSAAAETVPLPVNSAKEHSAANRQRRQHIKAQRNESKDREGRDDIIHQSATPAMDSNTSNHRNISRSDVKSSGAVSHSRAHWKPKSTSLSQGNNAAEGQVDSRGDTYEVNSSEGFDSTNHQDNSGKSIKRTGGTDEKDAHIKQENLTPEDGKQNNEAHAGAEQQQVNPPVRCQGHHNGRYNRGGAHRGRGYDAGRPSHGTNTERRKGGSHLEYQPVGSYKPRDFQQNPSFDERTEGLASGPVFRERSHSRGGRPAGHFVKRNPASTSTTNTYQE